MHNTAQHSTWQDGTTGTTPHHPAPSRIMGPTKRRTYRSVGITPLTGGFSEKH